VASKHLQTRRFLDTLNGYLVDVHNMLSQIYRKANERPAPWVDHAGNLGDAAGMKLAGTKGENGELSCEDEEEIGGYSFFNSVSPRGVMSGDVLTRRQSVVMARNETGSQCHITR
jgi:carnitine O-acetyltransferase